MSWMFNETVRCGNSSARVKNYYADTGLIVLYDIVGEFAAGDTIVGDESGTSLTLTTFTLSSDYDFGYDPDYWTAVLENGIYDGNGKMIALDRHFTGKVSQDYQTTYLLAVG